MTPDTDPRRPDGRLEEAAAGDRAASLSRSNRRVAISVLAGVALMTGAAYASVPLYELFCQVTGYGGTTQRADAPTGTVIDRKITVRFDGNVNSDLPWEFKPTQRTITLRMGESAQVAYVATNRGGGGNVGTSVFNVTPFEAGSYFNKIECFCFTEQTLQPGETVEMPIVFFVDPDIDENRELDTIKEITLSYTFYASDSEGS